MATCPFPQPAICTRGGHLHTEPGQSGHRSILLATGICHFVDTGGGRGTGGREQKTASCEFMRVTTDARGLGSANKPRRARGREGRLTQVRKFPERSQSDRGQIRYSTLSSVCARARRERGPTTPCSAWNVNVVRGTHSGLFQCILYYCQ